MIEVSSEQSRSQFYIHKCCWRCRCCSVCYYCFFSFCYVDTVCGFTAEYLDLIDCNYYTVHLIDCNYYTVRCTTYGYVFVYTCVLLCSVLLWCCCLLCCLSSYAGGHFLSPWFTESDSSVFFIFIQRPLFFNVPLVGTTNCRLFSVTFSTNGSFLISYNK